MAGVGLIYNVAGDVIGYVSCSQDSDLDLQEAPFVEVANDHDALTNPAGWEVLIVDGLPTVQVR